MFSSSYPSSYYLSRLSIQGMKYSVYLKIPPFTFRILFLISMERILLSYRSVSPLTSILYEFLLPLDLPLELLLWLPLYSIPTWFPTLVLVLLFWSITALYYLWPDQELILLWQVYLPETAKRATKMWIILLLFSLHFISTIPIWNHYCFQAILYKLHLYRWSLSADWKVYWSVLWDDSSIISFFYSGFILLFELLLQTALWGL